MRVVLIARYIDARYIDDLVYQISFNRNTMFVNEEFIIKSHLGQLVPVTGQDDGASCHTTFN